MVIACNCGKDVRKNYNYMNRCSFMRIISLLNLDLLKGDISFFASFLQLLNFFPFPGADCVFRYFVTLHQRFIYLETSSNRRLGKCVRHFKGEILFFGYWDR